MPLNKIALIRYKTIDQCLRNRNRNWTLENLIEACSEAVNKIEGTNKGASKRTVQGDLQLMRNPIIGYHAPIKVIAKKYYTYADANYSITNQPISEQDVGMILEATDFMNQLLDFDHFKPYHKIVEDLESIIKKDSNVEPGNKKHINQIQEATTTIAQPYQQFNDTTFKQKGNQIITNVYSPFQLNELHTHLSQKLSNQNLNENGTFISLKTMPEIEQMVFNENLSKLLNLVDKNSKLTSVKYYHQIPTANWFTTLHQNITIPVKEKLNVEGYSGWSKKEGIDNVMAPVELLKNCFSVFIYLFDTDAANGALQVLPGSHKQILNIQVRNQIIENLYPQVKSVKAGGVHIVKPLLLMAFSKVLTMQPIHLIQLNFSSVNLPGGLQWLE